MTLGMDGKTVVIAGAAGGVGTACARQFLAANARLLLIDSREDAVKALQSQLDAGADVDICVSDLSSPAKCAGVLDALSRPIYALVHLAGTFVPDSLRPDDRTKVFDAVIAVNLTSAYDMAVACLPHFDPDDTGRIVLTSSLAFRRGSPGYTAYTAAKGGVVGLTRSLARRLAPGVLVNAVAPGLLETPMTETLFRENRQSLTDSLSSIPLGRFGQPDDVAKVIRFLCSDDANYITGQTINIDGGQTNA